MWEGIFNTHLKKEFIWMCRIYTSCHPKTECLASTNSTFGMQRYLQVIGNFQVRRCVSKIRGSSHCLEVETGRYTKPKTPREERFCQFCKVMYNFTVETADPFLHHFAAYQALRDILKNSVSLPDKNSLSVLARSKDNRIITYICNWIATMYKRRCKDPTPSELTEDMAIDMVALGSIANVTGTIWR